MTDAADVADTPDTLAGLVARLDAHAQANGPGMVSVRRFREAWGRYNIEQRVARAIRTVPESVGPLNSQRMVIRSLATMREVSPDYLARFIAQVDTLMWLEDALTERTAASEKGAGVKGKGRSAKQK